ncbi:MAG: N-succinylarginine dihydrolase, partial [Polyangiaceae bacterium]|nr:N-succinylarginine dihydrolase [Polyangiaceae bacterium]
GAFFMFHELAFADPDGLERDLRRALGDELLLVRVPESQVPVARAVAAYPFNSQVVTLADGTMAIVAPADAHADRASRALLEGLASGAGPVRAVHYIDVRQSMQNGGGPACLRLRVPLTAEETSALGARVVLDDALDEALSLWIGRHYRDRLMPADLADPALAREGMRALDELTALLGIGAVYDFQRA